MWSISDWIRGRIRYRDSYPSNLPTIPLYLHTTTSYLLVSLLTSDPGLTSGKTEDSPCFLKNVGWKLQHFSTEVCLCKSMTIFPRTVPSNGLNPLCESNIEIHEDPNARYLPILQMQSHRPVVSCLFLQQAPSMDLCLSLLFLTPLARLMTHSLALPSLCSNVTFSVTST